MNVIQSFIYLDEESQILCSQDWFKFLKRTLFGYINVSHPWHRCHFGSDNLIVYGKSFPLNVNINNIILWRIYFPKQKKPLTLSGKSSILVHFCKSLSISSLVENSYILTPASTLICWNIMSQVDCEQHHCSFERMGVKKQIRSLCYYENSCDFKDPLIGLRDPPEVCRSHFWELLPQRLQYISLTCKSLIKLFYIFQTVKTL